MSFKCQQNLDRTPAPGVARNCILCGRCASAMVRATPTMIVEQASRPVLPEWAQRERWTDLAWLSDRLPLLHLLAGAAFDACGRGALLIDTTRQFPERGHPTVYLGQGALVAYADNDLERLVTDYTPPLELVVVLLKAEGRRSTYRMQAPAWGEEAA